MRNWKVLLLIFTIMYHCWANDNKILKSCSSCECYKPTPVSSTCFKEFEARPGINFHSYQRCLKRNGTLTSVSFCCPKGRYFDPKARTCISTPGGGNIVYADYNGVCKDNYKGVLNHPTQKQFYYICKDCVVFVAKCPKLQIYDPLKKFCVEINETYTITAYDESNGKLDLPACKNSGRFPVDEDPKYFYMCTADGDKFYRSVFKCPFESQYDPAIMACSQLYKGQVPSSTTMGWYLKSDPYPPCVEPGRFRSNRNCSLYFVCSVRNEGGFYQSRYSCPSGMYYSVQLKQCRPSHEVECNIIEDEIITTTMPTMIVTYGQFETKATTPFFDGDKIKDEHVNQDKNFDTKEENTITTESTTLAEGQSISDSPPSLYPNNHAIDDERNAATDSNLSEQNKANATTSSSSVEEVSKSVSDEDSTPNNDEDGKINVDTGGNNNEDQNIDNIITDQITPTPIDIQTLPFNTEQSSSSPVEEISKSVSDEDSTTSNDEDSKINVDTGGNNHEDQNVGNIITDQITPTPIDNQTLPFNTEQSSSSPVEEISKSVSDEDSTSSNDEDGKRNVDTGGSNIEEQTEGNVMTDQITTTPIDNQTLPFNTVQLSNSPVEEISKSVSDEDSTPSNDEEGERHVDTGGNNHEDKNVGNVMTDQTTPTPIDIQTLPFNTEQSSSSPVEEISKSVSDEDSTPSNDEDGERHVDTGGNNHEDKNVGNVMTDQTTPTPIDIQTLPFNTEQSSSSPVEEISKSVSDEDSTTSNDEDSKINVDTGGNNHEDQNLGNVMNDQTTPTTIDIQTLPFNSEQSSNSPFEEISKSVSDEDSTSSNDEDGKRNVDAGGSNIEDQNEGNVMTDQITPTPIDNQTLPFNTEQSSSSPFEEISKSVSDEDSTPSNDEDGKRNVDTGGSNIADQNEGNVMTDQITTTPIDNQTLPLNTEQSSNSPVKEQSTIEATDEMTPSYDEDVEKNYNTDITNFKETYNLINEEKQNTLSYDSLSITPSIDNSSNVEDNYTDYECPIEFGIGIDYNITCEREGSFALNNSCQKYYDCVWNDGKLVPKINECPKCLRFNDELGYCDHPHNVPRCNELYIRAGSECESSGNFSITGICDRFKECILEKNGNYTLKIHLCPDGENFNNETKSCDKMTKCLVEEIPTCEYPGLFADDNKCNEFYQCLLIDDTNTFMYKRYRCPPSLVFNQKNGTCDFPKNVPGCAKAFR